MVSLRSHLAAWQVTLALAGFAIGFITPSRGADDVLTKWLDRQATIKTWSANFTQSRMLSTLNQPLVTKGRVEFAAPSRFRWELGEPAQTIAIREPERITILYPRLKRAEQFPLDANASGPWKDAMALLDAGFPRSRTELDERFELKPLVERGDVKVLSMKPRAPGVRKMLDEVQLEFHASTLELVATEMSFKDGSRLRNDFSNSVSNAAIAESQFRAEIPSSFKVMTPSSSTK